MRDAGAKADSTSSAVPEQNSQQPASNASPSSAPANSGDQASTNAMQQKTEQMTIAGKITDGNKPTTATVSIYKVTEDGMQPVMKDVPFSGSYSINVPSEGEYSIVAKSSDGTISTKDVTTASAKPETAASSDISVKPLQVGESMTFRSILFDTDKWSIRKESNPILDDIAAFLTAQPSVTIEIAGHTDYRASDDYNTKLSLKRAESIRNYLIGKGIKAIRLSVKGYGASKPVTDNTSLRGMYLNRRVEFLILTR